MSDEQKNDAYEKLKQQDLLYRGLLDSAPDGILVLRNHTIVDCNTRIAEILSLPPDKVIGSKPWELGREDQSAAAESERLARELVRRALAGETPEFEWRYRSSAGHSRFFDATLSRFDLEDGPRLLCRFTEITQAVLHREELSLRKSFLQKLSDISSRLLRASSDDLPDVVAEAFSQIATMYGAERGSVWWLSRSRQLTLGNLAHGYGKEADSFVIRDFTDTPWTNAQLFAGRRDLLHLPDDLPDDAVSDHRYLVEQGIRSLLLVPVTGDEQDVAVAGLSMTSRPRRWTEEERFEIGLLMRTVGTAWMRCVHHYLSQDDLRDLRRTQRVAGIGSFQILPVDNEALGWDNAKIIQSEQADRLRPIAPGDGARAALREYVHEADRDRVADALADIDALEKVSPVVYRICADSGKATWIEEHYQLERAPDGSVERIFGTLRDVSDHVRMTTRLEQALDEIRVLKDRLQAENLVLRDEVRVARGFGDIVGSSPALRRTLKAAEQVAPTDVTVLLLGETGTGKELIARSIHAISGRRDAPLVSVNCAAIANELIESELFGHERGAFTDAVNAREGRFELADGGTLFLDEIGELPQDLQAKLLRVLQTGEFERIGGSETVFVDARIVAATNRDLAAMVDRGEFRQDLYYRINQFPIKLPPLRERVEDIPELVAHFIRKHGDKLSRSIESVSDAMLENMMAMPWPGNVRELESYVQRAMLSTSGPVLDVLAPGGAAAPGARPGADLDEGDLSLTGMQRRHIRTALETCGWLIDGPYGAAAVLGLPPSSLRSKMKRLGIERPH
ncbi:MAG: sigma 54-interacting transcriptional regulator [Woeseiaceae bacterium]|nr:sigma 54-interacting transcriptional regulator [Woeseiaceae bacterium]